MFPENLGVHRICESATPPTQLSLALPPSSHLDQMCRACASKRRAWCMPATSLPPSAGLPRSSCLEVRPVVFGGNPRVVDLSSRGTSLLCSSWGAPVPTSEPGLRQVCVLLLAAGCCIPPFHISPGDNVWVKVVSRAGQRLGLAMRDVDQATGEDLLPMAGGAGRGQPNGAGAGAAPSALHGLSGIKVRGPGFCL